MAKLMDFGTTSSFVWAKHAGGLNFDGAGGIAVNGPDVYISGSFGFGTATFGNITLTNTNNGSTGITGDAFVAKLTDAGSSADFTWVQQITGTGDESAATLTINGADMYVAGSFNSATSFGGTLLTPTGYLDLFITKLTDAGSSRFVWAQRAGVVSQTYAKAIAVSATSVYVVGIFSGASATFGAVTLANTNSGPAGSTDSYLVKLTDVGTTGSFIWAQRPGGSGTGSVEAVAASSTRACYELVTNLGVWLTPAM